MLVDPRTPENLQRDQEVIRRGEKKEALVLVAPVAMKAPLPDISGRRILRFWATPLFDVGDGIQMNAFLRRAGERVPVGARFFDPGRNAEDRAWVPISIPLDLRTSDQLEIEVSAGPQGDLTADWLALSSLRLTTTE